MSLPADPFVIVVSRRDVESCNTSDTLAVLRKWVETSSDPREVQGKLQLWFEGYDSDHRELWLIPRVRTFVKALDEQFPYWFVFADLGSEFLKVLVFCLCRVSSPRPGATAINPQDLATFFERHFGAMNQLLDHWSIGERENKEFSSKIIGYFEKAKILN